DSASLVAPEHHDAIVITGSHGGLLGGRPETALKYDVRAAFYNDAGIGIDEAGVSRLPALDQRGIAAATVAAASARIGDARSTYEDGMLSRVNARAAALGLAAGMPAREAAAILRRPFAADAYARVTNKPGICDGTLGPGATNLVTGLVESLNGGIPVVAIAGDTNRGHSWKNMTQECRQAEILKPAVKELIRVEQTSR